MVAVRVWSFWGPAGGAAQRGQAPERHEGAAQAVWGRDRDCTALPVAAAER